MRLLFLLLAFISVLFIHCRPGIEVTSEHEPDFKLENYNTFSFVTEDTTQENQLVWRYLTEIGIIKDGLRGNLTERGISYTESNPDLRINIGIVIDEKVQTRETNIVTDPPQYIGQRRYTWRVREVEVGRYQQGTVTVHLVDNQNNELVWMGIAEAVIPRNRERQERQIKDGIQEMVKKIP